MRTGLQLHISPRYRFAVQKGSSLQLVCNITNLERLSGITVDVSLLIWYKDSRPLQIGKYFQKVFVFKEMYSFFIFSRFYWHNAIYTIFLKMADASPKQPKVLIVNYRYLLLTQTTRELILVTMTNTGYPWWSTPLWTFTIKVCTDPKYHVLDLRFG